jgi:hypothetical protein
MKVEGADWGRGLVVVGGASGHGVHIVSGGTAGDGLFIAAGGTGAGVTVQGGPSAGVGVQIDTTNGDGIDIASTGGVDIDANITGNITGNLSGNVAGNLGGALTTTERTAIADAYLDRADGIESGITPRKALRAIAAIVAGLIDTAQEDEELFKAIGAALNGTTRVTFEVDSEGNRNAVIFNL